MKSQLVEKIVLTEQQKEVLNGALLGDGSLIIHKNGVNAYFSYLSKIKAHVEFVGKYFKDFISSEGIKDSKYFDNRTKKTYYHSYFKTYSNKTFTDYFNKWYSNNEKHIPKDLILTPLICLIWYIGDGGICHSNKSEYIKLSTHCFSKIEQENILLPQLSQFEASLMNAGNNQYYIYIPHRKEKDFLKYIGDCPFDDYKYKWKVTEYINSIPKNHTNKEKDFCEKYRNGMTYYAIAKEYGIEPNAVKYYLIKNNLYKAPNKKLKNTIIHLSKDNEYIGIYRSGTEASKKLNLSSSMISSVKTGRKRMKDSSYFKSYKDFNEKEQEIIKEKFKEYFEEE